MILPNKKVIQEVPSAPFRKIQIDISRNELCVDHDGINLFVYICKRFSSILLATMISEQKQGSKSSEVLISQNIDRYFAK